MSSTQTISEQRAEQEHLLTPTNDNPLSSIEEHTHEVSKRTFCGKAKDFCKALWTSRIMHHMVVATGVALAIFYFATPPGWFTLGIGAFAGIIGGLVFLASIGLRYGLEIKLCKVQQLEIEIKSLYRCAKGGLNSSQVFTDKNRHTIHIGSFPNRTANDLQKLVDLGIKTVVSVTHPEERKQIGYSIPYTEEEYRQAGIKLIMIDVPDHTLLGVEEMSKANAAIKDGLEKGSVLAHCQGGNGRSAQAIAAYLMATEKKDMETAKKEIKDRRPQSTIGKKDGALKAFEEHLRPKALDGGRSIAPSALKYVGGATALTNPSC